MTRVRFPSPAPVWMLAVGVGLVLSAQAWFPCGQACTDLDRCPCGSVVEHSLGKGEVARSIRAMGTNCKQDGGFALQTLVFEEKPKWQKANSNARSRT